MWGAFMSIHEVGLMYSIRSPEGRRNKVLMMMHGEVEAITCF